MKILDNLIVDSFFDLNYEIHHARLLDNDEPAASNAENKINQCIEMYTNLLVNKLKVSHSGCDQVKGYLNLLNEYSHRETHRIVLEYGRNHHSGNDW